MTMLDFSQVRVAPTLHWLEAFGLWLRNTPTAKKKRRGQKTIEAYLLDVGGYRVYFENVNHSDPSTVSGRTLEELLNSTDLQAYFQELEKEAKPATYNRKLASLRMLVKFAQEEGLLDYDPLAWVPFMEAVRKSPRDLSAVEQDALNAALEALPASLLGLRDRLIVELMLYAGLRIHEAVGLQVGDLCLDKGYIAVLGKGKKKREIEIGSKLIGLLRTWLERRPSSAMDNLISDEGGRPITTGQARRRFYAIRDAAGLDPSVTPHALRHTYVNNLLIAFMAGDPTLVATAIKAVCQLTGDDPKVILEYYTNPRASDIRAAVERMNERKRPNDGNYSDSIRPADGHGHIGKVV